jgi:hypothetical protein
MDSVTTYQARAALIPVMRPTMTAGAARPAASGGDLAERASRPERSHVREMRARNMRGLIACAVFLFMLGAAVLIGNNSIVNPTKNEAVERKKQREAKQAAERTSGWIVQELPDGLTCQYLKFDNITAQVGQPNLAACEEALRVRAEGRTGFSWGR